MPTSKTKKGKIIFFPFFVLVISQFTLHIITFIAPHINLALFYYIKILISHYACREIAWKKHETSKAFFKFLKHPTKKGIIILLKILQLDSNKNLASNFF